MVFRPIGRLQFGLTFQGIYASFALWEHYKDWLCNNNANLGVPTFKCKSQTKPKNNKKNVSWHTAGLVQTFRQNEMQTVSTAAE